MDVTASTNADKGRIISVLKEYFSDDENVLFALLFGSYVAGRETTQGISEKVA
jgi:predicted nucleotidyltransferase